MRPGFGKIFPGMGGRIGRNIALLPIGWRPGLIVMLKSEIVVLPVVAEDRPALLELVAIADQQIPIMMPDLMAKMAEQGPVSFAHLQAPALPFDVVGLGQGDGDDTVL